MGNGWHEWPLVIFTVLGQCVVGALIVSGIGWFAAKNDADRQRIVRFFPGRLTLVAMRGKPPFSLQKCLYR